MDLIYKQQYKLFLYLINGYELKIDEIKYPDTIFCFVNNKIIFEYDKKNGELWINFTKIWFIFQSCFSLNNNEISKLLGCMVEEHFKLKILITMRSHPVMMAVVEKHLIK